VETLFSMIELEFGGGLSSRGQREQKRELRTKAVLHNTERLGCLECVGRGGFLNHGLDKVYEENIPRVFLIVRCQKLSMESMA